VAKEKSAKINRGVIFELITISYHRDNPGRQMDPPLICRVSHNNMTAGTKSCAGDYRDHSETCRITTWS